MEHGPLLEGIPVIKGFICGSLVAGSFTVPNGMLVQLALFIVAALVFLDSLFIFGRESHLLSFLVTLVIGLVAGMLFALAGLINPLLVVVFVVMAIIYLYEFMGPREAMKRKPEKEPEGH